MKAARSVSVLEMYGSLLNASKDEHYWQAFFAYPPQFLALNATLDDCVVRTSRLEGELPEKLGEFTFHPMYIPAIQDLIYHAMEALDGEPGVELLNALVNVRMVVQWLASPERPWANDIMMGELIEQATLDRMCEQIKRGLAMCQEDDMREDGFKLKLQLKLESVKLGVRLYAATHGNSLRMRHESFREALGVLLLKDKLPEELKSLIGHRVLSDALKLLVVSGNMDIGDSWDFSSAINYTVSQFLLVFLRVLYTNKPDILAKQTEESNLISWITSKVVAEESYDAYLRNYMEDDMNDYYNGLKQEDEVIVLDELIPIMVILHHLTTHSEPYWESFSVTEYSMGILELLLSVCSFIVPWQKNDNIRRSVELAYDILSHLVHEKMGMLVTRTIDTSVTRLAHQRLPLIKPHHDEYTAPGPRLVAYVMLDIYQGEMRYNLRKSFVAGVWERISHDVFKILDSLINNQVVDYPTQGDEFRYYNWGGFWDSKFSLLQYLCRSQESTLVHRELILMEYLLNRASGEWGVQNFHGLLPTMVYRLLAHSELVKSVIGDTKYPLLESILEAQQGLSGECEYSTVMSHIASALNRIRPPTPRLKPLSDSLAVSTYPLSTQEYIDIVCVDADMSH